MSAKLLILLDSVVVPRQRATRHTRPVESDSDIEVVEDGNLAKDEGYESAASSESDGHQPPVKEEDRDHDMDANGTSDEDADENDENAEDAGDDDGDERDSNAVKEARRMDDE